MLMVSGSRGRGKVVVSTVDVQRGVDGVGGCVRSAESQETSNPCDSDLVAIVELVVSTLPNWPGVKKVTACVLSSALSYLEKHIPS